jgi:hypothetical protein
VFAPAWATGAILGAVISAEVYVALAVALLVVIRGPLGFRPP